MDPEILKKLEEQEDKLDKVYRSVERMRKYFLWTLIVTLGTIILPLIALAFVIPWFLNVMSTAYNIH